MKKLFLTATVIAAALFNTGCSKDDGPKPTPEFGDPAEVVLLLESPATRGLTGATEDGEPEESKISHFEIYVYASDGTSVDRKVGEGGDTDTGDGYYKTDNGKLTQTLRVSQGDGKQFLVIANSNIGKPAGRSFEQILKELTKNAYQVPTLPDNSPRVIPDKGFEMSGYTTANVGQGNNNNVPITITRTVGKINAPEFAANIPVQLQNNEQVEEIWGGGTSYDKNTEIEFEFKGYAVVNGYNKSDISFVGNASRNYKNPKGDAWTAWSAVGKSRIASKFIDSGADKGQYESNYSGPSEVNSGSWFLDDSEGPVYIYESKPELRDDNEQVNAYKAPTVVSYIIEGELTPAGNTADKVTRYWRVNLTKDDIFHIMRNVVYKVKINSITSPGYGTPEDAENPEIPVPIDDVTADFVISIAPWDINEYETDM